MNYKLSILIFVLVLFSCSEKNPASVIEEEHNVLTTVNVVLRSGSSMTFAIARDTIKVKGKSNTEDTLRISSEKNYLGEVRLYNESVTPIIELTNEIIELPNEHMFVFTAVDGIETRVSISNLNKDQNGKDVGQTFNLTISGTGKAIGNLRVRLRHYDSGDKNGIFDTEADVKLPVIIN